MTGTAPATRVAELPTAWMREHLHEVLAIYGAAMGYGESVVAGRYGYAAKGLALVLVGVLFVLAAWHASAQEARGLDGALRTLLQAPGGQVLLGEGHQSEG